MTKMVMKFPPSIGKDLSKIIKIDKLHEKDLIIKNFSNYLRTDIFTQNSMIKSLSSIGALSVYMLPTQKHYKFIKKTGCRWQRLIKGGGGVVHASAYFLRPPTLCTASFYRR